MMKLVNCETAEEVKVGDELATFRGEKVKLISYREPQHANSTGRVYISWSDGRKMEVFPTVVNCVFTEEE